MELNAPALVMNSTKNVWYGNINFPSFHFESAKQQCDSSCQCPWSLKTGGLGEMLSPDTVCMKHQNQVRLRLMGHSAGLQWKLESCPFGDSLNLMAIREDWQMESISFPLSSFFITTNQFNGSSLRKLRDLIKYSLFPSLLNKTLTYWSSSSNDWDFALIKREKTTFFAWESWSRIWRCCFSSRPLHTELKAALRLCKGPKGL